MADQISDAVLDTCLADDPYSRVACEVFISRGFVLIGGEVTTEAWVNFEEVGRSVVRDIGYTNAEYGIDANSMAVFVSIGQQSPDLAAGVNERAKRNSKARRNHAPRAGDQGMMFGYACNETKEYMPAPIMFSHSILMQADALRRKDKNYTWLRPDAKCQVTILYEDSVPKHIDSVVLSHQHADSIQGKKITHTTIKKACIDHIIYPALKHTGLLNKKTAFHINPTGRFVIGGPSADTGLTGRKIIVDTYGGVGGHGGGAFSGKDPSKVDRSASYFARYIAKNVVAAGLAKKCQIQIAYAVGEEKPVSFYLDSAGTGVLPDEQLSKNIQKTLDMSPAGIIQTLDLLRPIYQDTAVYGHFGRNAKNFTWEKLDLVKTLLSCV
ncbi:S-adenosylmethionine synthase-like [Ylistrum balloti]|uniref:S-adenosylmethionine synthase-like n=1 Tax=Ylistrum balloti TaxID=509963 RepID=UPI002905EFB5|nr:S-adenosylmethionine synthase-like [Ylistrum balloti]